MEDIFANENDKSSSLSFDAVIFDLDGVITQTAKVHSAAWKAMFDEYLQLKESRDGLAFQEFTDQDYLTYVDGKPRYDGVDSFLKSRDIELPMGSKEDVPATETVCGLGNRKNDKFMEIINTSGVEVYPSTVELIKDLKRRGIHVGVASSSKNCQVILQKVDLESYFETRVDGVVSAELGLNGKPAGDIFVKAAENMGVSPDRSIVVEDAVSGVQAGVNGGFLFVVGLARENNQEELAKNGADIVLDDFGDASTMTLHQWISKKTGARDDMDNTRFGKSD